MESQGSPTNPSLTGDQLTGCSRHCCCRASNAAASLLHQGTYMVGDQPKLPPIKWLGASMIGIQWVCFAFQGALRWCCAVPDTLFQVQPDFVLNKW
jgi:hypothetical protein